MRIASHDKKYKIKTQVCVAYIRHSLWVDCILYIKHKYKTIAGVLCFPFYIQSFWAHHPRSNKTKKSDYVCLFLFVWPRLSKNKKKPTSQPPRSNAAIQPASSILSLLKANKTYKHTKKYLKKNHTGAIPHTTQYIYETTKRQRQNKIKTNRPVLHLYFYM